MLLYLASHSQYVASRNNWLAAWRHGGVIYWGYWKYQNDKQESGIWLCLHLGTCWCGGKANTYLKKSKFINFHWSSSMEKSLSTLDSNQLIPHQRNGKCLNVEHSSDRPLPTPHSSYLGSNKLHSLRCRTGEEAGASNLWYTAGNTTSMYSPHFTCLQLNLNITQKHRPPSVLRAIFDTFTAAYILNIVVAGVSVAQWYRDINPNQ